jgi:hypothetical protein
MLLLGAHEAHDIYYIARLTQPKARHAKEHGLQIGFLHLLLKHDKRK